jgi:glycosyltransferase involved in cell wall biosynthesis
MERPKVSIIIPTFNSGVTLTPCLESVRNQSYSRIETIVVDNFSTDETALIAAEFDSRIIRQKSTPAMARNIGITNSSGKYIFFLDSDQVLSRCVIEECVRNCELENAGMVRVPEVFAGRGFWSSCSAEWKNLLVKVEQEYSASRNMLTGEPRFFVREQLVRGGMLDDSLLWAEDYDLHKRMEKMKIKETSSKSKLYHYEPATIKEIVFKIFHYGSSMSTYTRRTGQRIFWPMTSGSLLTLKELFRECGNQPRTLMGCVFLLFLKTFFIVSGVIKSSMTR